MSDAILKNLGDGAIIGNKDHTVDTIPKLGELAGQKLTMLVCDDTAGQFRPDDEKCCAEVGHVGVYFLLEKNRYKRYRDEPARRKMER